MKKNFSKSVQRILKYAKEEAIRLGHSYVGSEHLLLGIILDNKSKASKILESIGIPLQDLQNKIESLLRPTGGTLTLGHLPLTRRSEKILRNSFSEAEKMNMLTADDSHLLLAISLETDGIAKEVLDYFNADYELIYTFIASSMKENIESNPTNLKEKRKSSKTPTLDLFSRDFSKMVIEDKLDPVIGRNIEIERVAQILSRRKKNNPVLIGEPGVGKTAIVEGLAIRIQKKTVPRVLWGQRVVALDLAGLIAGTKYRGQFEERIRALLTELEKSDKIIIFIDELHTIVGAGAASGSMDAANLFKPALARGDIQIIGATTLNEYRKYIEKDGALERRFQKILVNQPSIEDTVKILLGLQQKYENHHQIQYLPKSIDACVELSERYITDKFLPDKAIDVMDEVGARIHINNIFVPDNIVKLEDEIRIVRFEKEAVIKEQQFEKAASLRDKERKLINKLSEFEAKWNEDNSKNLPKVNEDDVANVISMMTGIPINRVAESESVRLINMSNEIGKEIIGQETSIEILSRAIRRARTGFKDPRHPIGSFMFVGPTGVGKTEMAKALARHLFGNENSLIKMDMSEYMERHNVSRLIGAPPGYVGYDEGGQLTEKVRRNPFSVVLFDEIEKAHPDVYNLLLQILDEGKLSDNLGRMIDFRNTIVIMTTNLGTKSISETSIGFSKKEDDRKELELNIHADIKKRFKPEFLNRLDEVIIFNQLTIENLIHIIDIQLQNIVKNLSAKNIQFKISKKAKELLIQDANYKEWGARPLRRIIQNRLENYISEKFLTGEFTEGGVINVKTEKGNLFFTQIHKKTKKKTTAKPN